MYSGGQERSNVELLPCPFCGKEACRGELYSWENKHYYAHCSNCEIEMSIEDWNTRAKTKEVT